MKILKGFTIIELIVSVAIFAFMTAFLVAKYGSFNQSVLLTNLAYDVALTIRNAQTYGLNVKSRPSATSPFSSDYEAAYGVHFDSTSSNNRQIIFFADSQNGNNIYNPGEEITKYTLRNGGTVSAICTGTSESNCTTSNPPHLDITFTRPDPSATFGQNSVSVCYETQGRERCNAPNIKYAEITLRVSSGQTKKVIVRSTGQIAVLQEPAGTSSGSSSPSP
jgi:prepilin-type N-terminal cleavage/methylation domain-containing protein